MVKTVFEARCETLYASRSSLRSFSEYPGFTSMSA
jgi:hypothetical protein